MPNLPYEIEIPVFASERKLKFTSTEDVRRWLETEEPFWKELHQKITNNSIKSLLGQQVNFFNGVRNNLQSLENTFSNNQQSQFNQFNQNLVKSFDALGRGTVLASRAALYPAIVEIEKNDPNCAGLLYLAARSDADQYLGHFGQNGQNIQFKTLLEFVLNYPLAKKSKDWLAPQRNELVALRDEHQAILHNLHNDFLAQKTAIEYQQTEANSAHTARVEDWKQFIIDKETDWGNLKKVYDEQLALRAPTQYWKDRAESHKINAIGFASAFSLVLIVAVIIFSCLGMPFLIDKSPDNTTSLISSLVPIVVPAFIFIWVLKILSRLLSENIGLMRDARERETMVETFLALMRDDADGKPLIKDDDRILILHSLFRPSSITATDDAPPVHWFDVLTNKLSGKDSK
jgi:hypothetical protein